MAHSKKKKRSTKRSTKGTRKRRGRGVGSLADMTYEERQRHFREVARQRELAAQHADAESMLASYQAMLSPAKLAKSEAKAESKGCVAPKGKVCVDASVGRVKNKVRAGCKKSRSTPGAYICTESAVKAHAAGKHRVLGHRTKHKGYRFASWKEAINKSNGIFKPGCHFDLGRHRPVCKKKSHKRAA
jgi:hypothetical protein